MIIMVYNWYDVIEKMLSLAFIVKLLQRDIKGKFHDHFFRRKAQNL